MIEPLLKDVDKCVKCGGCKAVCPTFAYGMTEAMSARGRMIILRDLYKGNLAPDKAVRDRIYSCLLCGQCESACPAGVEVTAAIYRGRKRMKNRDIQRLPQRLVARHVLSTHSRIELALGAFKHLMPYFQRKGLIPFDLQVVDTPLRSGPHKILKPKKKKGRVAIFTGCAVNFLMPHLGDALIRILYGLGYEVVLPAGEVCCGAPHRALGMERTSLKLARRNVDVFARLKADAVVSLCPTCTLTIKKHYEEMGQHGVARAMDALEFLSDKIKLPDVMPEGGNALYHAPCHLSHGLGVKTQPVDMLRSLNFDVKLPKEPGCCGFSLSATHPEISAGVLRTRTEEYRKAETLVTACPGCMLQLERIHGRVMHVIELLDESISGGARLF